MKIPHLATFPAVPRVSGKTDSDQRLLKLGAAIRAQRLALGMSQEALADASGVDRSHMGEVERGKRNITFLNIARIAEAMSVRPSEIIAAAGL